MADIPRTIIHSALPQDALEIGPRLRQADLAELTAVHGPIDPGQVLAEAVRKSERRFMVSVDRNPEFLFGVGEGGIIWAMGTPVLFEGHRKWFMRQTRHWIPRLHETYPVLWNRVHSDNTVHINWLKWAGFEFGNEVLINNQKFVEFSHHV